MTFLVDAYTEEEAPTASGGKQKRTVLKLHPAIAPVKVAILPLSRNERLVPLAREVYDTVRQSSAVDGFVQYDDAQSIGRRYRRQDEIGTPLCITVDFDSLDDNAVTIRDRDTMEQARVPIASLDAELGARPSRLSEMRILHFADLHIGVENYGRIDPDTGLSSRLGDFLHTYDELVDYAIDTSVDLVLFCGDAYKSRDPSQTHQREFARRIARLSRAGIPTFLLVGNHDTPQVIAQATALEIFPTLNVANVHIGDRLKTYVVETRSGPLQVVALPWIKRSDFLASDAARGLTHQQINEEIQRMIDSAIRVQVEGLDYAIPAVLAGHVTISQSTLASEQTMMLGHDHVLLNSSVALPQFDYVALGHIHRHQVLSQDPHVVYAGSLQRVDFGEEKDEKGFLRHRAGYDSATGFTPHFIRIRQQQRAKVPHDRCYALFRRRRPNFNCNRRNRIRRLTRRNRKTANLAASGTRTDARRRQNPRRAEPRTPCRIHLKGRG